MRVLLLNLPWQRDYIWGVRAGSRWPHIKDEGEGDYLPFPFFLAYAASLLSKNNIEAIIIDAIADKISADELFEKITESKPDYIVIETSIPSFNNDLGITEKISKMGFPVILCGPNAEIYKPEFLEKQIFIDYVMCGEYEFILLELLNSLGNERALSDVKGLIYREQGKAKKNTKREPFDIDSLPWPHRETLPMDKYLDVPGEMQMPSAQMLASRGCPFKCQFCLWPQVIYQGHHYRPRSVKDVVDEMEFLVRKNGFKSIYFDDDTFNIGKKRMLEFCHAVKKRGLGKVQWAIMARPDLMDEEILLCMKESGLWAIKYGVESIHQHLVDNIEKGMDLEKSKRMIQFTQKIGIKTHLTFTFGLPGETKETIEKTIQAVKALNPFSVQFSILTPFPGTKMHDVFDKKGLIITKDFSSYDGHYKSVIKTEYLAPLDLSNAKIRACRLWQEHLRRRAGLKGNFKKFYQYARRYSLRAAFGKVLSYLKLIAVISKKQIYQFKGHLIMGCYGMSIANIIKKVSNIIARRVFSKNKKAIGILLIQCPPWDVSMPPLGIAYLTSYLEKHGFFAYPLDLNVILYSLAVKKDKYLWEQKSYDAWVNDVFYEKTWGSLRNVTQNAIKQALSKYDTKCVGLSVNFAGIKITGEIIKIIKSIDSNMKIIVGGWSCVNAHMRGLFPRDLVDVFVIGEGEKTLLEVMKKIKKGEDADTLPGAIFTKLGQLTCESRDAITDLDSIPWPTYDKFDLNLYTSRTMPLFTSRGCIGHCTFCNDWALSKPYRVRSAKNIFAEIQHHAIKYGASCFSFKDLLCNGNIDELNLLCELIISSDLEIHWDSQAIPYKAMTCKLLSNLKKAGCGTLIYGVENFSNNILRAMQKIFTKEIAERVLKETNEAGIAACVNIIVGFPGETEADFQENLDAIRRNHKYITQIGAVSVCLVNNDNDLDINHKKYGIVLSEDPSIRAKKWHTINGDNTYEIRRARAERLLKLIGELSLPYATVTL